MQENASPYLPARPLCTVDSGRVCFVVSFLCRGIISQRKQAVKSIQLRILNEPPRNRSGPLEQSGKLFALVACAHALVAGLAAVAVGAGLHLNAGKRAAVFVLAVVAAALNAATNVLVSLLVVHE